MFKSILLYVLIIPFALAALPKAQPSNATLEEQVQCYSIPYGGVGFVSHLATFYIIIMLAIQRRPSTWGKTRHRTFDQVISVVSIVTTVAAWVIHMSQCESFQYLVTIAAWELVYSIIFGCMSFHAACWVQRSTVTNDIEAPDLQNSEEDEQTKLLDSNENTLDEGGDAEKSLIPQETSSIHSEDGHRHSLSSQETVFGEPSEYDGKDGLSSEGTPSRPNDEDEGQPSSSAQEQVETPPTNDPNTASVEPKPVNNPTPRNILWWLPFYFFLSCLFVAGLFSFIIHTIPQNRNVERIVLSFGTFTATLLLLFLGCMTGTFFGDSPPRKESGLEWTGIMLLLALLGVPAAIGIVGPLMSDWVIAAVAKNFGGMPMYGSSVWNIVAYCMFLAARLLPFFFM